MWNAVFHIKPGIIIPDKEKSSSWFCIMSIQTAYKRCRRWVRANLLYTQHPRWDNSLQSAMKSHSHLPFHVVSISQVYTYQPTFDDTLPLSFGNFSIASNLLWQNMNLQHTPRQMQMCMLTQGAVQILTWTLWGGTRDLTRRLTLNREADVHKGVSVITLQPTDSDANWSPFLLSPSVAQWFAGVQEETCSLLNTKYRK